MDLLGDHNSCDSSSSGRLQHLVVLQSNSEISEKRQVEGCKSSSITGAIVVTSCLNMVRYWIRFLTSLY